VSVLLRGGLLAAAAAAALAEVGVDEGGAMLDWSSCCGCGS
jgi:hypothetical protein